MKHIFSSLFSFRVFSGALFKLILSSSFRFRASLVAQLVKIRLQCRGPGFDPWVGKILGEGKGYPLQYSGLENSMDCIVRRVAKSQT